MSPNKIKYLILMSTFFVGLSFAGCKTTPTASTPLPPQPESSETKDNRQSTPSATAESTQPEVNEKSKTSQTSSPEATAMQKPEPKEKSPNRQTASAGATKTQPQQTGQVLSENRKTAPQTADAKLAKARDDLRVSQATEKRIAAELERLKRSGNASAEDIRNYETYLERVQAMVAENRKMVNKMESAYAEHPTGQKLSSESPKLPDQQIPEEQVQDPVAELDRQLSASLTEFDGMLLKEMETIETESAAKMRDLAQEAAEAAKRLKQKGAKLDTDESKTIDAESSQSKEGQQGKTGDKDESREEKGPETQQGDGDDTVATADRSKGEGSGPKRDPGSRYNKEDDDIVARQLREAAENETDPELKEKLWKEYEEYKKNTQ
jgi:hypothetical protein